MLLKIALLPIHDGYFKLKNHAKNTPVRGT